MPLDGDRLRNLSNSIEADERSKQFVKNEEARLRRIQEFAEWEAKIETLIATIGTILAETAKEGKRTKRFEFPDWLCKSNPPNRIFKQGHHPKYFHDCLRRLYEHCERQNLKPELNYSPSWGEGDRSCCYMIVKW